MQVRYVKKNLKDDTWYILASKQQSVLTAKFERSFSTLQLSTYIPEVLQGVRTTKNKTPLYQTPTQRATSIHICTYKLSSELPISLMCISALWEAAGITGESPHGHRENMQSPLRKTWESNLQPSCCEAKAPNHCIAANGLVSED